MERTFIMIKPDGVKRKMIGEIFKRFEQKGYKLESIKSLVPGVEIIRRHYKEHINKPFYKSLEEFMTSGMVIPMVWSGINIISGARKIAGATNPNDADIGTIRGDYATEVDNNLVHTSDSPKSAEEEINTWFDVSELKSSN
ncbi:nucleoside diphosphate kinase [Hamiltosporidium tvaerminnensis]|uniref:Nucleoside diphosphate kinase n=1 Tax=Hamiltosporidium tvaerminnensis TaxID=1176355 RepID=A0A4Q9KTG6_9MICR|nr:hypothetical protein LUQ84_001399 [Hamiltosporidium tvaerminnensis]TBT97490.1 nucleoside diphosphate kinase [Hamiltosporidium tvaerminnensis]